MTSTPLRTLTALSLALALAGLAAPGARAADAPGASSPSSPAASVAAAPSRWDLTALYPSDAAWEQARQRLVAGFPALRALHGSLSTGPAPMLKALEALSAARRELLRLETYSELQSDADTRNADAQKRRQLSDAAEHGYDEASAWLAPEVVALGATKVDAAIAAEPGLKKFAYALHTMLRLAAHTRAPDEEALLAAASQPLEQPQEIYNLLTNAELPWPTIVVHGKPHLLDGEGYVALRDDPDPKVRAQVFKAFWPVWKAFERTLGATYLAHLEGVEFDAHAHRYATALDAQLAQDDTPPAVYRTLVAEAHAGLPVLHRLLRTRARLLGLKSPTYADLYAPLARPPRQYTLAQAEALTLQAVRPLGESYVDTLRASFAKPWMDAQQRAGKVSGAYMEDAAYDVHPYVLLTFTGNYESVTTVAHEWGHAMHALLSKSAQPFETASAGIFVSEIPSTTNEMLLADDVIAHARTRAEKIYALGQQLDLLQMTFFRQAMFAEFELKTHEALEQGKALTGADLSRIYLGLLREYCGADEGVMRVDPLYGIEWAYVPHFYRDFYVYQYATSISAAAYFAEHVEHGDRAVRDRYLDMLRAGGSDDPYRIVKAAGPDLATPEPYRALVQRMSRLLDELDALAPPAH